MFHGTAAAAMDPVQARRCQDIGAAKFAVRQVAMDILAPISVGELIDKITILRIKREKIRDAAGQNHVRHELAQLMQIRTRPELDSSSLAALEEELFQVNLRLWQVEDDLRDLERTGDFTVPFVELARSVYKLNDRRMALKKRINEVSGSSIVEAKSYPSYG